MLHYETLLVSRREYRAPCWLTVRGPLGLRLEIKQMPDVLVHTQGSLYALTALATSPDACQLLNDMAWGTMVEGSRLLSEDELELAFLLFDTHNLTTRLYV